MIEGSKNDWRTPGRLTKQFASKFNVLNHPRTGLLIPFKMSVLPSSRPPAVTVLPSLLPVVT